MIRNITIQVASQDGQRVVTETFPWDTDYELNPAYLVSIISLSHRRVCFGEECGSWKEVSSSLLPTPPLRPIQREKESQP